MNTDPGCQPRERGERENQETHAPVSSDQNPSPAFLWFFCLDKAECLGTWLPIYNQH